MDMIPLTPIDIAFTVICILIGIVGLIVAIGTMVDPKKIVKEKLIAQATFHESTDLMTTIEKIKTFKNLKKNWDSYNADPVNLKCIEVALMLVPLLYKDYFVCPVSDGSICFENNDDTQPNISIEV